VIRPYEPAAPRDFPVQKESARTAVVFSRDETIFALIVDASDARLYLRETGVEIVVVDDDAIEETNRGWLLGQAQGRHLVRWLRI
jgi:hypothetical protein